MMEGETAEDPTLFPATVGEKLRSAREAQGLELAEVAARTRIPQRHLEAIEKSNYDGLPSITYAIGFAKSYARAVGADEVDIARDLRTELGHSPERMQPIPTYEMEDPTRVPPRGLALGMAALVVIALIGFGLWYGTGLFRGSAPPPETLIVPEGNVAGTATSAPIAGGHVTLVALDTVWLRVSDAGGQRLFEKEMAKDERYDVPMGADGPHVRTPRPDRLQVLINGAQVAPLAETAALVDVGVSAAALQARGQAAPAATTPVSTAPVAASAPAVARTVTSSASTPRVTAPVASTPRTVAPAPSPTRVPVPSPSPTRAALTTALPTRAPVRPTPRPTPTERATPAPATGNSSAAP